MYSAAVSEMPDPVGGYPFFEETPLRRISAPCARGCAVTDCGRLRIQNEDTFYINDDASLLIAADGLGGHPAVEVASAIATRFAAELIESQRAIVEEGAPDQVASLLAAAIYGAHEAVRDEARCDPARAGMGCTLIVAVVTCGVAYVGHVGDVRGYLFAGDGLTQITDDHSPVGEMVRAGVLTAAQARLHPEKHLITQAIGLEPGISPELSEVDVDDGESLLLCSDGLWEAVADEEIAAILLACDTPYAAAVALADAANARGGPDNLTALVYSPGAAS